MTIGFYTLASLKLLREFNIISLRCKVIMSYNDKVKNIELIFTLK